MATLYQRKGSPFYWLDHLDTNGERQRDSLELRHYCDDSCQLKLRRDLTEEERTSAKNNREKAEAIEAEATFKEKTFRPCTSSERWDAWVPTFMEEHYQNSGRSLRVRKTQWKALAAYLEEKKVETPRQLTRDLSRGYIAWRWTHHKVITSSALSELKFLSVLVTEAVDKGWLPNNNACSKLKLGAGKTKNKLIKLKPELTPEMVAFIETHIIEAEKDPVRKKFLRNSHLIAKYHGCRVAETYLKIQEQINVTQRDGQGLITKANVSFIVKGGDFHTVELHPKLFPLFNELEQEGATETFDSRYGGTDEGAISAAQLWHNVFEDSGARKKWPGICFHCHRVTAVTKMARAGVSLAQALRFIGHGSYTVHQVYLRLEAEDLPKCIAAVG